MNSKVNAVDLATVEIYETTSPVISVNNLIYSYPGTNKAAVNDVSFDIRQGEIFGLLGPSGAGKSTIQRVLTRQNRRFDAGSVSVLGKDIREWDHSYYERIGVGFELPNHYLRLTGLENLEFFASLYSKSTLNPLELLEMVGLEHAADVRVSDYSKGMKMRLNFIRPLLHNPEILFLDEPTSGLDPVNSARVKEIIKAQRDKGTTIVLTTHNMYDVEQLCDRVGFMLFGKMPTLDQPEVLKARFGERLLKVDYSINDSRGVTSFVLDKLADNPDFMNIIRDATIHTMHSQEASLDQVFSEVTGSNLDADEDVAASVPWGSYE